MTINFQKLAQIDKDLEKFPHSELLIVTKNQSIADIEKLCKLGYTSFGENRVQEAQKKFYPKIKNQYKDISLHLIGPLQSNKVKAALEIFDVIQSVDRKKITDAIAKELQSVLNVKTKSFFIQINIGSEEQKSGINLDEVEDFYHYNLNLNLNVKGFMCIPPNNSDPKKFFDLMNNFREKINPNLLLSMGMSSDYLEALQQKSNLIRVGSSIFN